MFDHISRKRRMAKVVELEPSAPEGEARRITGVVKMLERTLNAPCSGRICVAHAVLLRDDYPYTPESGQLARGGAFDYVELVPFAIEHAGGVVMVDSQYAELELPHDTVEGDRVDDDRWRAFLEDKAMRYRNSGVEAVVQPGQRVTLVGVVEYRVAVAGAGYRDGERVQYLVGDFDHPVVVAAPSDD